MRRSDRDDNRKAFVRPSPVLLKQLLTYLLCLAFPLITFIMLMLFFVQNFIAEINHKNMSYLVKARDTVDHKLYEIQRISYQLSNNPDVTKYALETTPFLASKELFKLDDINELASEILIYAAGSNYFWGSNGSYRETFFFDKYFPESGENADFIRHAMHHSDKPFFTKPIFHHQGKSYMAYITPIPYNVLHAEQRLLILINMEHINHIFNDYSLLENENLMIVDEQGDIISSQYDVLPQVHEELAGLLTKPFEQEPFQYTLDKNQYYISTVTSELTGWKLVRIVPKNEALAKVVQINKVFMVVLASVVIGGMFLILLGLQYNYRPILELLRYVRQAKEFPASNLTLSGELAEIRDGILSAMEQSAHLSYRVTQIMPAMKQYILSRLLQEHQAVNELEALLQENNLLFQYNKLFVMLVLPETADRLVEKLDYTARTQFSTLLERFIPDNMHGYVLHNSDNPFYILILSTALQDQPEFLNAIQQYKTEVEQALELKLTIAIGDTYREINKLALSLQEARLALDYRLVAGTGNTLVYANIAKFHSTPHPIWGDYPQRELHLLTSCLMSWDLPQVEKILQGILATSHGKGSIYWAKCICYDVLNLFIRTIAEKGWGKEGSLALREEHFTNFDTMEQLFRNLLNAAQELDRTLKRPEISANFEEIVSYIKVHFGNYDCTVESIASHFGISSGYLRRIFHTHLGMTASSYINQLRIDKAKELLVHTDQSLTSILSDIGYIDASSFIKKFKHATGITPGQYRITYRAHN